MTRSLVAAFALASTSLAAAPALAEPFQGPYVGVEAGLNHDSIGHANGVVVDHGKSAFAGGAIAGYDYKLAPRVVVGAEAGLDAGIHDAVRGDVDGTPASIDPQRQINVTARAGYLVNPRTLVYARAGYANVRVRTTTIGQQAEAISRSSDLNGWTLGGGTERALTSNVSARVEYRYTELGQVHGRFDRHQVLAGLAYHF
ncbi:outer membrane protein [Sphingomonas sp. PR090111-T3T-6A]|uniref:outer membrane protein n=1 Tax=Sphingomonas sp. PR090111-T3T-6A TaxID=685778 RepID=UPI000378804A|nr:outer membrane beta-barrel protein [Sphingomonas sp. PR090111-T3T-6A]